MPASDEKPLNREPPLSNLISSFITTKDGYNRNHGPIPSLSATTHRVRIDGAVSHPLDLTIPSSASDYPQHTVVCALQCAGNRRHTMRTQLAEVEGIDWFDGAVMNCRWRGPRLADISRRAGVELDLAQGKDGESGDAHVAFASHAVPCQDDTWYGASIPLSRASDADKDVISALEMNDAPLTPSHGYPVRVVTPGIAGARAVKWVDRITVQRQESSNFYQQHDYKVLPPQATDKESAEQYWHSTPSSQSMPVNSVVAVPGEGETVERNAEGRVKCKGYASPSGDCGPVVKVEVSGDEGKTWEEAEMVHDEDEGKWSWKSWTASVKVEPGEGRRIVSRATDSAGNTQDERSQWNSRGVGYSGYGEVLDLRVI